MARIVTVKCAGRYTFCSARPLTGDDLIKMAQAKRDVFDEIIYLGGVYIYCPEEQVHKLFRLPE